MIGQAPRIVLIDDKRHHLHGLAHALGRLDSACLPFHFQDIGPSKRQLRDARVIFCDLHLLSDTLTADTKQQLSVIAGILSEGLEESHGPFVLVIWTEFPDKVEGLDEYLQALEPGQRPIEYVCFNKNDFINSVSGDLIDERGLIEKIQATLAKWSGVTALLWWESAVADAAASLASALWASSGEDGKVRPEGLRQTFGKLAFGSAGSYWARSNPGMAVNEALVPMLADRIEKTKFPSELWSEAVEFDIQDQAAPSAKLSSLVHLDFIHGLSPLQRGAASPLLAAWRSEQNFKDKFGYDQEVLLKAFGFSDGQMEDAKTKTDWYLIQIRAACDEAQMKPGLIPFVLAALTPKRPRHDKTAESVWRSEHFQIDNEVQRFYAHANFVISLNSSETGGFSVKFRLRNSLYQGALIRTHGPTVAVRST